jgi:phosphotransferase system HPr-like phosphotransfer protein
MTQTESRDTPTASRDVIVREDDFRKLLAKESQEFGGCVAAIRSDPQMLRSPAVMARLAQSAHELETFLDHFGARQNRTFVTFGEMVASARGLAAVGSIGLHLAQRLKRYQVLIDREPLAADLEEGQRRLLAALCDLLGATADEGSRLGSKWCVSPMEMPTELPQRHLLPRNLDESEAQDEREHVAEIGARFLKVLETSRSLNLGFARPRDALREFVSEHATEERCRWYESTVHSIQSMYDTFVLNTVVERDHPWLAALRGHVSVALHLLEMATGLVHFYERHESDVRHVPARKAIASVVGEPEILDIAVNVCLRHAYLYVESASALAHQILQTFVSRAAVALCMPAGVTLHARPLALIVQVARHYGTPLEISLDGESCSANSLMSLILLGGRHPRPQQIRVQGDARALHDLELLFASGLGEHGRPLAPGLEYLRIGS